MRNSPKGGRSERPSSFSALLIRWKSGSGFMFSFNSLTPRFRGLADNKQTRHQYLLSFNRKWHFTYKHIIRCIALRHHFSTIDVVTNNCPKAPRDLAGYHCVPCPVLRSMCLYGVTYSNSLLPFFCKRGTLPNFGKIIP